MTTTQAKTTSIYKPGNTYQVPPGALLLQRNIRDAQPDAGLLASVAAVGVLEPITAVLNDAGELVVRFGQRRTLAAIDAGRDAVPVYVTAADDASQDAEILRVIEQHDENTHRAGLTASEEIGVVEQLTAFGMSHDQIVEQARIAKDHVVAAATVSNSKLARKAAAKYEALTLDQAATVAEFDGDADTARKLIVTAIESPQQFAHAAQRARDDRDRNVAYAAAAKELEDAGVKVVEPPGYDSKTKPARLDALVDDKGKPLTPAAHKKCPGSVAWLSGSTKWTTVDGKERRTVEFHPIYGCSAPAKNGHKDRHGSSSRSADMTDAEREAAKKARRLVIDNNRAWDSAEVVRREWLVEFAKRKTPPKGAAAFIAQALAGERMWLSDYRVPAIVVQLLGGGSSRLEAHVAGLLKGASENRAQVVGLSQILAAIEATTSKQSWREDGTKSTCGRYLRFLESAGYPLSDVEKFAISGKKA